MSTNDPTTSRPGEPGTTRGDTRELRTGTVQTGAPADVSPVAAAPGAEG
ncbi:hypothetical protein [Leucobacter tenebrionis]|nr:hypothetical protein [Leucobacter tenebrionis]QZY51816.1 hypothetical protein KVY00_14880 [Leucobacter tenebrionis]